MITLEQWIKRCEQVTEAIKQAEGCKPFNATDNGVKGGLLNGARSRLALATAQPYSSNNSMTMDVRLSWLEQAEGLALQVLDLGKEPEQEKGLTFQISSYRFEPPAAAPETREFKRKKLQRIFSHVRENADLCPIFHVRTVQGKSKRKEDAGITIRTQCTPDGYKEGFTEVAEFMTRMDESDSNQVKRVESWWHKYAEKGGGKVWGEWLITPKDGKKPFPFKLVQDGGIEDWEPLPTF